MAKNLLIVESPAKAKTIEKFLGKDFEVVSSYGHIRDLAKGDNGIDIEKGFKPAYIVPDEKLKVVSSLKSKAQKAEEVWLASDEDREGESISWHLAEVLKLDPATTKRIVFHEITKPAIQKAIQTPRTIDLNLVNAQQARRVLDRLVGFELSPVLWRKIGMTGGLSAGRVQSVAVRLIVEREREIIGFTAENSFKIDGYFKATDISGKPVTFKAEGPAKLPNSSSAENFLNSCKGATYKVADIQVKPAKRTPSAPFTTSTLQQEASRKLGFGVSKTMRIAQTLYENGHITYMRTDSINLSDTAMADISQEIKTAYGNQYYQPRKFKNKNESAQEAHEAIRPTYISQHSVEGYDERRLYDLIWKRTIASQMSDAAFEKTIAKVDISTNKEQLTASGEVLKFDGFLKVYLEGKDDEDEEEQEGVLPPLTVGQQLAFKEMLATEKFTRPAPRYTEASLVKKLEELGIGRPSTYAPTITTIMKRNYVEKREKEGTPRVIHFIKLDEKQQIAKSEKTEITGADKGKLVPTDLGMVVTDFLTEHFKNVMDYNFTARVEAEFDEIAEGKLVWNKMIHAFYGPFHLSIEDTLENAGRATGERELGVDPVSGKKVYARMGRFGPMVQIGEQEDAENRKFASLRKEQSIETISFEEAMDLFKLPMTLGQYKGQEVLANVGRFGPYVKWGESFISLPKGSDPLETTMEQAIGLIDAKIQAEAPIGYYQEKPVTKGTGRFGPYIKWEDYFINVPKAYDFDNLNQTDIDELVSKKIDKEANRYIHNWPAEKIAIENGRWGPFIRYGKISVKLGKRKDGERFTAEDLQDITLEEVKKLIEKELPGAFDKKAKKAAPKKAAKKAAPKKAVKKAAPKKTAKKAAPKKTAK
ncbi:DNA topoisomerase I [Arachidicoccus rhizosphaerae]|uniref:DNA topoisomerase 1 n=1 Tax=Arachidicoccus rhizosphaerae TaxID=551991 RepID=A0A1H3XFP2_9BACT|nr:type I DNA topoisomerase [Arachidicoccus rhizosphaerae]SDZ98217.1 DNA topoisomerase I [Arachidicoccus rhizosphaerae]